MHKSDIQAVLFENKYYNDRQALKWLQFHHHLNPIKEVHTTKNFLRYRIVPPSKFDHFITIKLSNHIQLIIGFYPNGKTNTNSTIKRTSSKRTLSKKKVSKHTSSKSKKGRK